MKQNETFELSFHVSGVTCGNVDLKVVFKCNGEETTVYGFYDGNDICKIRFLPQKVGVYTWTVSGIVNNKGEAVCEESDSQGIIHAVATHFEDANGKVFLPVGTTIYALSHQTEELTEETFETLKNAPFNKVRHCIFPKHYDYNLNEPRFYPFEKDGNKWNVNKPNPIYWQNLESNIIRLGKMGIQSDLILFHSYDRWGFSKFSREEDLIYLDYALRRFASIPCVWWSMANEYDLIFNKTIEDWYAFEAFIASHDPYHHLLSNHNGFIIYDFSRKNITHCSLQTSMIESATDFIEKYNKPVVYDECRYEGDIPQDWGNMSAFNLTNSFWTVFAQGAYCTHGEVFLSDDDVLWWAKGGKLKGESPQRIGFLKEVMESIPQPITPWKITFFDTWDADEDIKERFARSPFFTLMNSMTPEQKQSSKANSGYYCGRCGDDMFIEYLARHCNAKLLLPLPKNHTYNVDVIDVWEMTRKTVLKAASGITEVSLPAKEGIAVIAIRKD